MDWLAAHLQAAWFVARAHWHAAVARLAPPVQAAFDWLQASVHALFNHIGWTVRAAAQVVWPSGQTAADNLALYWPLLAIAAIGVVGGAMAFLAVVRWRRRRRQLKASLVEVNLDRDPRTSWLNLDIVVRNFQPHGLIVHSVQVLQPRGTKICERWRAWTPDDDGVHFVAPDLDLTDAAVIERTIPAHGASRQYDDFGDDGRQRQIDNDELKRSFYLLPPGEPDADPGDVRAVLHCEIEGRTGRKQALAFSRSVTHALPAEAGLPAPV